MIHIGDREMKIRGNTKELLGEVVLILLSVFNDNILKEQDEDVKTELKMLLSFVIATEIGLEEAQDMGIVQINEKVDLSNASDVITEILRNKTFTEAEEEE